MIQEHSENANRILELRQTKAGINQIMEENKGLVGYLLNRRYSSYFRRGFAVDDLFAVGMVGLWTAIRKFDPELGSFSTYASWRIRSTIGREIFVRIREKKRIPRISLDALDDKDNTGLDHVFASDAVSVIMSKLKARDREALAMRYLQGASLETIGKRLNVTRERARQIIDKARNEAAKLCQNIGDSCIQ